MQATMSVVKESEVYKRIYIRFQRKQANQQTTIQRYSFQDKKRKKKRCQAHEIISALFSCF